MMDQVIFIYIVAIILLGQCVNETAARRFQPHIAVMGNDRSHTHIAFLFCQVNVLHRFCIHTGRIFAEPAGFRKRIHNNSLFRLSFLVKCANTAVHTGQTDFAAFYRHTGNRLGNVAFRFQRTTSRSYSFALSLTGIPPFAGQSGKNYVARQLLSVCRAAHYIYINVTAVIRERAKLNPVFGSVDFVTVSILRAGINPLTHRRDMDVFNIIFCLQIRLSCSQACPALLDDTAA